VGGRAMLESSEIADPRHRVDAEKASAAEETFVLANQACASDREEERKRQRESDWPAIEREAA